MWHNEPERPSIWPEDEVEGRGSWWAFALALVFIALGLAAAWIKGGHHG